MEIVDINFKDIYNAFVDFKNYCIQKKNGKYMIQ